MILIRKHNRWLAVTLGILVGIGYCLVIHIQNARAEESVEFTVYWSASSRQMTADQKFTVIYSDLLGFARSDNALFNDLSFSAYCLWQIQPEGPKAHCYSKYMDADSHYFILESMSGVGPKFLYGTGKFEGITGRGMSYDWLDNKQKPIRKGTTQGRGTLSMTYELPKSE